MDTDRQALSADALLNIDTIYLESSVPNYARGREILARFPDATRIEVPSHWQIPELHGNAGLVEDWLKIKRTVLVLGVKKSLPIPAYERSADFIAPSHANGCASACVYCYVPRRKGFANPITTFVNSEAIEKAIARHAYKQGFKFEPTQPDPSLWVYEIGTNNDCAVDALISDNVKDLVKLFRELPNAKATFATKFVNRDLLTYDPQGRTRLRFSLMPPRLSRVVDIRTSPVEQRIAAINDFVAAGYEVNLNFGPVIYTTDSADSVVNWLTDYALLFDQIDDQLNAAAKAQLAAEVIFLTHNAQMHDLNLQWHPKAEDILWQPALQETKISGTGGENVRYKMSIKSRLVNNFCALLTQKMPYCKIRYAF